MEEKTLSLDDGQYGSEEQQETKGFGDSTECGWMQGILGLSDSTLKKHDAKAVV